MIWIISIFVLHMTILAQYYSSTIDRNPKYIRKVLIDENISKNDVIAGNEAFYPMLHDYNYLFFLSLVGKKESFEELVKKYEVKIILYDAQRRNEYGNNEIDNFLKNNCTLIRKFHSTYPEYDPIYLYQVNL